MESLRTLDYKFLYHPSLKRFLNRSLIMKNIIEINQLK